ncbi:hypothetical protein [Aquimarina sp. AU474]|uniref:hypothetical protein n=1 Tax=Aquimarina sp. AU474 TaxID=2108529 RepID=UPI000D69EC4A|nr:hypothetical protein [Aquimarina sp. AU474]
MKLQIINATGTYEIEGDFILQDTELVRAHFNYLLDHYEEIVMCLNKVKKIDQKAVNVLKEVYAKAQRRSKILFVYGKENKIISKAFKKNKVTHFFKDNY